MKNPLIIHHANCIDGFTAAWACWCKFGDDAEYVPAGYGDKPPDVAGRDVLIVDFSYPRDVLLKMHAAANSLLVLDHHHTAQEALAGLDFAQFDMDRSGAGMAWDHLFPNHGRSPLVSYVEDRDLWRFELPESKAINAVVGATEQTFAHWSKLAIECYEAPAEVARQGTGIMLALERYVRDMAKQARLVKFCEFTIPVVNAPYINTIELVGHLAETHHTCPFAMGWFQRSDGKFQYSLRSRSDFDVSAVAQRFGGGGHKQAAGFTTQYLRKELE